MCITVFLRNHFYRQNNVTIQEYICIHKTTQTTIFIYRPNRSTKIIRMCIEQYANTVLYICVIECVHVCTLLLYMSISYCCRSTCSVHFGFCWSVVWCGKPICFICQNKTKLFLVCAFSFAYVIVSCLNRTI